MGWGIFGGRLAGVVGLGPVALGIIAALANGRAAYSQSLLLAQDGVTAASLEQVVAGVGPGTVVIISERHDDVEHHLNQVRLLEALEKRGYRMHVGMEFFAYPDQPSVDAYLAGSLEEQEFLTAIGWVNARGQTFSSYREQVLFPRRSGGRTLALNLPRSLTGRVAKDGLERLTAEEKGLFPPDFTMGNDDYFARFRDIMLGGHVDEAGLLNYFAAQSLWDDTMAWQATKHMAAHPDDILVVLVGDVHAIYGGGLPDRLKARGQQKITTISQTRVKGLDATARRLALEPHPVYGPRADYIWATEGVSVP